MNAFFIKEYFAYLCLYKIRFNLLFYDVRIYILSIQRALFLIYLQKLWAPVMDYRNVS